MENKYENQLGFFNQSYIAFNDEYMMILTENFKKHSENNQSPKYKLLVIEKQTGTLQSFQKGYLDIGLYSKTSEKTGTKYYSGGDDVNFYSLFENAEKRVTNPKMPMYSLTYNKKTKQLNNNDLNKSTSVVVNLGEGEKLNFDFTEEVPF